MSRHLHHARALDLFLSQYVDTGYLFLHDSSGRFALEPTQMIREKTKKHLTMVYFHFKFQYVSINRSSISSIKPPFHALTKLEDFELGAFGFLLKGWLIVEKHFEGQGLQKNHLQHLWAYCFIYAYHRSGDSGIAWRTVGWQSSSTGFCPSKVRAAPREWMHPKVSQDVSFFHHICSSKYKCIQCICIWIYMYINSYRLWCNLYQFTNTKLKPFSQHFKWGKWGRWFGPWTFHWSQPALKSTRQPSGTCSSKRLAWRS